MGKLRSQIPERIARGQEGILQGIYSYAETLSRMETGISLPSARDRTRGAELRTIRVARRWR